MECASLITLATCSLNQWSLDFEGNWNRVRESIIAAKKLNAAYRLGPELEICGYGCNDHFYEQDTLLHSWQVLGRLLDDPMLRDIVVDVGMPVEHKGIKYNCRVIFHDSKLLLIRPKLFLANDGNYREGRWFSPWVKIRQLEEFKLPKFIQDLTGQVTVPIGDAVLESTDGVTFGTEICEELFTPNSPHIHQSLDGVEIFTNGSASHHELRKLKKRVDLISHAMAKSGGVYLYANQLGCDGERTYYDGSALVVMNGQVLAQASQFSMDEVQVVAATVDLDQVRSYRGSLISRCAQGSQAPSYPRVQIGAECLEVQHRRSYRSVTSSISPVFLSAEEEIALGPACWLWDYLRRSKLRGFFLPLSGGIDSASTALIVTSMCRLIMARVDKNDAQTLHDLSAVVGNASYRPTSSQDLANKLFHTCYMGSSNSSAATRQRALTLAKEIGSYHIDCNIDSIVNAFLGVLKLVTGNTPRYKSHGGSQTESLALQNIQARSRMVLAYLLAQLLPWCRNETGSLLVLGAANVDESLRGYFTKYDCSSADLNPIGGISKQDITLFVRYWRTQNNWPVLDEILLATPTAELEPLESGKEQQSDEADMGMTYAELSTFGRLRKICRAGPYSMFTRLLAEWPTVAQELVLEKVKRFFFYYAINRHKMTTLPPSYHAESYSPDDNRFDLRPILYNAAWSWQFKEMDNLLKSTVDNKHTEND